ncbi:Nuclear Receptor-Interacting Protein 2 [Manis pentadactyla]|nr:Nuclear Receptor-Interacting Protein 2 [Manis pentadactyla]
MKATGRSCSASNIASHLSWSPQAQKHRSRHSYRPRLSKRVCDTLLIIFEEEQHRLAEGRPAPTPGPAPERLTSDAGHFARIARSSAGGVASGVRRGHPLRVQGAFAQLGAPGWRRRAESLRARWGQVTIDCRAYGVPAVSPKQHGWFSVQNREQVHLFMYDTLAQKADPTSQ